MAGVPFALLVEDSVENNSVENISVENISG
jgi:hypothetical protein